MAPTPAFTERVPPGDDHARLVCDHCAFVDYRNPRVVVGSVVRVDGGVLLCRRAIEPSRGRWTLPAGYLELGESVEDGARREAWEEARARLRITALLAVYSIARIGQVQLIHLAELAEPGFAAGPESLEVAVFDWDALPGDLAFPSVRWALDHARAVQGRTGWTPFGNPG